MVRRQDHREPLRVPLSGFWPRRWAVQGRPMPRENSPLEEATIQEVLEANVLMKSLDTNDVTIEDLLLIKEMIDDSEWKQLVVDAADKMGVDLPYG